MDRERAETFLRLLAEAELRRATAQPGDRAVVAGCITRVMRVVRVLTVVGALGDELGGQVLDDFELDLGTRGVRSPGQYGLALRSLLWSLPPGQPPHAPDRGVPAGQVIPLHGERVSGEVTLLSYAQTEAGALLTLVARPGPLPGTVDGLGDVIAALQASGALPPASPVPGQLAALCGRLNLTGHGITAPPARDLPEPWLSVLTHRRTTTRTAAERDGCAAVAAVLPDLDELRLSILGLTSSADGAILHTYASGPMRSAYYGSPERNLAPAIWIHDSRGAWHATRVSRYHDGDITMRLQVLPPLSHDTTWIEVIITGLSAEARAILPLRWQQKPLPGQRLKRANPWGCGRSP